MRDLVLLIATLLSVNAVAGQGIDAADMAFDIDPAPPGARGKVTPVADKPSGGGKYTDAAGLYTFLMPAGWTMEALDGEPPGIVFRGGSGKDQVNCVLSIMNYRRGPRTLAELQATPEQVARAT